MPRALGLAVDLVNDAEEEHLSLIELSEGGGQRNTKRRGRPSPRRELGGEGRTHQNNGPFCKLIAALLALLIVVVYKIGVQEGINTGLEEEDSLEDVENKVGNGGGSYQILKPKGGGGGEGLSIQEKDDTEEPTVSPTSKITEQQKVEPIPETSSPTPLPTKAATQAPVPTFSPTLSPSKQTILEGEEEQEQQYETDSQTTTLLWTPQPNPYISKFNTSEWIEFHNDQWQLRVNNSLDINAKYGMYCPNEAPADYPQVDPMCPELILDENNKPIFKDDISYLANGPTVKCIETGLKEDRCGGRDGAWLNKTIWPLIRGPFCAEQNAERKEKFPLPEELAPYYELGYDRVDPTKSKDGESFDGGSASSNLLPFDGNTVKEHFLKFEAMLDHYYEGLSRQLLGRQIAPEPDSEFYGAMLKRWADQMMRIIGRVKDGKDNKLVIGVLGDSVTSGTDNCYYDAWPESLRRQLAPLFSSMGIEIEIRNAGKNGGWNLASQMLCAYDMLGASDRPDELGLDFLFLCNKFVKASFLDAEHLIRRALLGKSHTLVSITTQDGLTEAEFLENFASYGFNIGKNLDDAPPELGIPGELNSRGSPFRFWFPNQNRAFWGMPGDGFCHLTTRAGSSAIVNRNWHWGPKLHERYADVYALLLSRATRMAIEELLEGRLPPEPPKPSDIQHILTPVDKTDIPPTWKHLLLSDMSSEEAINEGLGGVRCAVGSANQPGSTLLSHWLRPAEGSPFEETMNSRNGASFVPVDHLTSNTFYKVTSPISPPNKPVPVGDWVADLDRFGEEAPRSIDQCRHVDGSTLVNMQSKPPGTSWLVWEVPQGAITIGRVMMCHPRGKNLAKLDASSFVNGNVRFHIAIPDGGGGWTVHEDVQMSTSVTFVDQECTPIVVSMPEEDIKLARDGIWVAVEWSEDGVFDFDYLVAI